MPPPSSDTPALSENHELLEKHFELSTLKFEFDIAKLQIKKYQLQVTKLQADLLKAEKAKNDCLTKANQILKAEAAKNDSLTKSNHTSTTENIRLIAEGIRDLEEIDKLASACSKLRRTKIALVNQRIKLKNQRANGKDDVKEPAETDSTLDSNLAWPQLYVKSSTKRKHESNAKEDIDIDIDDASDIDCDDDTDASNNVVDEVSSDCDVICLSNVAEDPMREDYLPTGGLDSAFNTRPRVKLKPDLLQPKSFPSNNKAVDKTEEMEDAEDESVEVDSKRDVIILSNVVEVRDWLPANGFDSALKGVYCTRGESADHVPVVIKDSLKLDAPVPAPLSNPVEAPNTKSSTKSKHEINGKDDNVIDPDIDCDDTPDVESKSVSSDSTEEMEDVKDEERDEVSSNRKVFYLSSVAEDPMREDCIPAGGSSSAYSSTPRIKLRPDPV